MVSAPLMGNSYENVGRFTKSSYKFSFILVRGCPLVAERAQGFAPSFRAIPLSSQRTDTLLSFQKTPMPERLSPQMSHRQDRTVTLVMLILGQVGNISVNWLNIIRTCSNPDNRPRLGASVWNFSPLT